MDSHQAYSPSEEQHWLTQSHSGIGQGSSNSEEHFEASMIDGDEYNAPPHALQLHAPFAQLPVQGHQYEQNDYQDTSYLDNFRNGIPESNFSGVDTDLSPAHRPQQTRPWGASESRFHEQKYIAHHAYAVNRQPQYQGQKAVPLQHRHELDKLSPQPTEYRPQYDFFCVDALPYKREHPRPHDHQAGYCHDDAQHWVYPSAGTSARSPGDSDAWAGGPSWSSANMRGGPASILSARTVENAQAASQILGSRMNEAAETVSWNSMNGSFKKDVEDSMASDLVTTQTDDANAGTGYSTTQHDFHDLIDGQADPAGQGHIYEPMDHHINRKRSRRMLSQANSTYLSLPGGPDAVSGASSTTPVHLGCGKCDKIFTGHHRKGSLARHNRQKHRDQGLVYKCEDANCDRVFCRKDARLKHYRKYHQELASGPAKPRKYAERRRIARMAKQQLTRVDAEDNQRPEFFHDVSDSFQDGEFDFGHPNTPPFHPSDPTREVFGMGENS
ncbi:hypothetical protein NX059_006910 [Plenodomus lindquistii]|nr:hypothetical protein NX059_006910 [Plenodomus lindquistii]